VKATLTFELRFGAVRTDGADGDYPTGLSKPCRSSLIAQTGLPDFCCFTVAGGINTAMFERTVNPIVFAI
jgi:hypothetical protein